MRKELNHQGIFLNSRIRMKKLFVILIGKEQQFDLVIKKEEGSNDLLSNIMNFRKYRNESDFT